MTINENLLITLSEECAEVQQAISKLLRFGKNACSPITPDTTNEMDVLTEYYQLAAVMEMLIDQGVLKQLSEFDIATIKSDKKSKVEHYQSVSFPHAHWVAQGGEIGYICSNCGSGCLLNYESDWHESPYCPHCGAKMEENQQKMVTAIKSFRGKYFFLSNFYSIPVIYKDIRFENNEAAFQAAKCPERMSEFCRLNPQRAKQLGRRVKLRPDWESVKYDVMYEICLAKFSQHPDLRTKLIATGDAELVEGNAWGDRVWGVCGGVGENHLGKILMRIRKELRALGNKEELKEK